MDIPEHQPVDKHLNCSFPRIEDKVRKSDLAEGLTTSKRESQDSEQTFHLRALILSVCEDSSDMLVSSPQTAKSD